MILQNVKLGVKIQIIQAVILLFSFVLIGFIGFSNFNKQNDTYHRERLKRKEKALLRDVEYHLKSISEFVTEDNFVDNFESYSHIRSDINQIDINFYNLDGKLIVQSNPDRFNEYNLPQVMSQGILDEVLVNKGGDYTKEIKKGSDIYFSSFFLIRNKRNEPLAILNIPYFDFNEVRKKDLEFYLRELALIYIMLLVIAFFVSYILTKIITDPLKDLSNTLKDLELSGDNKTLDWDVNDEIGDLIKAYNNATTKLKVSADLLAQKEREGAWREMAKQVAHEVKNPLTPMKLQVQFLQQTLTPNDPDFKETLNGFSEALIEQIDNMTNIANEFSNFASLPKLYFENFQVYTLLKQLRDFYRGQDLHLDQEYEECEIIGDKHQLQRVFNNLIRNGYQSVPEGREPELKIYFQILENTIKIHVKDNGSGIPNHIFERIFEPKFTTKDSGKGLGLAMVKNIVKAHKGNISVETELNKGTIFTVELPKA